MQFLDGAPIAASRQPSRFLPALGAVEKDESSRDHKLGGLARTHGSGKIVSISLDGSLKASTAELRHFCFKGAQSKALAGLTLSMAPHTPEHIPNDLRSILIEVWQPKLNQPAREAGGSLARTWSASLLAPQFAVSSGTQAGAFTRNA
jgi:hypothetical protein